ncbi:MAG: lipase family protein [Planctomycetes bacterium]|nr:lipase family protein [Planctomycetota bacterium]
MLFVVLGSATAQDVIYARLARGGHLEVHLVGEVYRDLAGVQVVQGPRSAPQPAFSVQIGPFARQARLLRVGASSLAPLGSGFRIEGVVGRSRMVLPLALEVSSSFTSPFVAPPTSTDPAIGARLASSLSTRDPLFVEPLSRMARYGSELARYLPVDPVLEELRRGAIADTLFPSHFTLAGANDRTALLSQLQPTLVLAISPADHAFIGDRVTIHSNNLPCPANGDSIRVWLDDIALTILESTPDLVTARLPKRRINGSVLRVGRVSDRAQAIVHTNYHVDRVRPFDFLDESHAEHPLLPAYLMALASRHVYSRQGATQSEYHNETRQKFVELGLHETLDVVTQGASWLAFDTQFVAAQNDNNLVVSFCGTDSQYSPKDILTDIGAVLLPELNMHCCVHHGFYAAQTVGIAQHGYQAVFERVRQHAAAAAAQGRRIWITGHSLGGAIAQIVAYRLEVVHRIRLAGVVTFGQPRAGDAMFALFFDQQFGNRAERWVNFGDSVATFFPWPFQHAGRLRQFDAQGHVLDNAPQQSYLPTLSGFGAPHLGYWELTRRAFLEGALGTSLDFGDAWPLVDS